MPAPLLVHLVFHPRSDLARALALALHGALNDDPALPGLRIPTRLSSEDGSGLPPASLPLDDAEQSFVVVLADDEMVLEPPHLPPGRKTWGAFVADVWEHCQGGPHRVLPVQLTASAWPLDPRLKGVSFPPAYREPPGAMTEWVVRRTVVELCRFLLGRGEGASVPVRLFLSHAKVDLDVEPRVFRRLVEHLDATKPIDTWVDSAQIEGGSEFGKAIAKGVQDSELLVLLTGHYSSRTWCRREVLLAKEHQRPLVVVDALEGLELRGFPYLGNVPVVSWTDGGAARVVDLVLKETLRRLHVERLLKRQQRPGEHILTAPPEAATLIGLPRETPVLYPDPPLGDEELELLAPLRHTPETPLQRAGHDRRLQGRTIALSISESDDLPRHGLSTAHLDAVLIDVSRHLLVRGAVLAYGGHLGSEGYTARLGELVQSHNAFSQLPAVQRIRNYVGWPLPYGTIPKAKLAALQAMMTYIRVPRPGGIESLEPETFVEEPEYFPPSSAVRRYAWARGMTQMRERQVADLQARVILGGKVGPTVTAQPDGGRKTTWYSGRIPGVIEEALLTLRAGQPLFVCGGFGGAANVVADLLEGRSRPEFTWDYQKAAPFAPGMREVYEQQGVHWEDYDAIADFFAEVGVEGVARDNGLSEADNRALLRSSDPSRIVELLLAGLAGASSSKRE
jgi:hypothetical protein